MAKCLGDVLVDAHALGARWMAVDAVGEGASGLSASTSSPVATTLAVSLPAHSAAPPSGIACVGQMAATHGPEALALFQGLPATLESCGIMGEGRGSGSS